MHESMKIMFMLHSQSMCENVEGGRRGSITLGCILQFATGLDEEPPLFTFTFNFTLLG